MTEEEKLFEAKKEELNAIVRESEAKAKTPICNIYRSTLNKRDKDIWDRLPLSMADKEQMLLEIMEGNHDKPSEDRDVEFWVSSADKELITELNEAQFPPNPPELKRSSSV